MLTLTFLFKNIFDITVTILLLRIWIIWSMNNTYNSFIQFITVISQPIVKPIQSLIPNIKNIEIASLIILAVVLLIRYPLLMSFQIGIFPKYLIWYVLIALLSGIKSIGYLIFWLITIRSIFSWFNRDYNDFDHVLNKLTDQILEPLKVYIPPIYNIDITPFIISIVLYLLNFLGTDCFPLFWSII
ncbi:YggT family protein [Enterobacteriaceae endosymbiont of Plateumaris pusilla]|uniref:YggT family protein n=1 Tax=Enterobacteriaceae endosymbiont of Plateumaris pusilla TaxID=2675795 RepID=UPI001448DE79|nr:YggT family protein [Enterobacteriaceae endosymbiont of Plateumaris pusilla]QJC29581.1 YggT family protein [Enterobacteriaceae endosymbiont of Plateumaris pusilla]